jgi:nucleoside-diphosphate-sugar epimerase
MVIGSGLLASAFSQDFASNADVKIFASGVSNSRETRKSEFVREEEILKTSLTGEGRLIYFSTCSIYDPSLKNSPYVAHKLAMEAIVLQAKQNMVFRLPQAVGHTSNKSTLANYLYQKLMKEEEFDVWIHSSRNLIDVADISKIAKTIIERDEETGSVLNIAAPVSHPIIEIVKTFERVLSLKARYNTIEAGSDYLIDTEISDKIGQFSGIEFGRDYLGKLLKKYYAK